MYGLGNTERLTADTILKLLFRSQYTVHNLFEILQVCNTLRRHGNVLKEFPIISIYDVKKCMIQCQYITTLQRNMLVYLKILTKQVLCERFLSRRAIKFYKLIYKNFLFVEQTSNEALSYMES